MEFSDYSLDFIAYNDSFLDILEGTTGAGKTVVAIFKFFLKVYQSKSKFHILSCLNTMKTEQNIINDEVCGCLAMFPDLIEYCPNGRGTTKVPHLVVHAPDFDKIVYFISYSDATKWKNIRAGRYGCSYIDEVNLCKSNSVDEVSEFITELLSRTDEYCIFTLNPDDPDLPLYKHIINRARPIKKYKKKGPKELRSLLNSEENKEYKWWFFDFYDNPTMSNERIRRIKESVRGNIKDWNSRILGLRMKTENLAFSCFDEDIHTLEEIDIKRKTLLSSSDDNKITFLNFYGGVDTSYSSKTDDLLVFIFVGITANKEVYILDEFTHNNRDVIEDKDKITASKIPPLLFEFLSKNSKKWGYPVATFIDEADSNLLLEISDYKSTHYEPFSVYQTKKSKFSIVDRYKKISDMIINKKYFVNKNCKIHIHELNVMTVDSKDKTKPADKNNHTYDAMCYAIEPAYLSKLI